jgi:hypothetical protein
MKGFGMIYCCVPPEKTKQFKMLIHFLINTKNKDMKSHLLMIRKSGNILVGERRRKRNDILQFHCDTKHVDS